MKKVGALVLAVVLCAAMLCTALPALAKTTVDDLEVDLTKCVHLFPEGDGGNRKLTSYGPHESGDGSYVATFASWSEILFPNNGSLREESSIYYFSGLAIGLKNKQDEFITFKADLDYSINVVYEVVKNGAPDDSRYFPQIGLCYNANPNVTQDNGQRVIAGAKNQNTGVYTLSTHATGVGKAGYALRLVFGGVGMIRVHSITIKAVSNLLDLTKIEQFGENVTGFTPATKPGDPVRIKFACGDQIAINNTTEPKQWLKAMLLLRNSDEEYLKLQEGVTYTFSVDYQVVGGSGQLAFVCNDNTAPGSMKSNNGSRVLTGGQAFENDGGGQKNLTVTYTAKAGDTGRAIRLAFGHYAEVQVNAIHFSPCANASLVTLVSNGLSTTDYMAKGDAIPDPAPRGPGYAFAGWYADAGLTGQPVKTADGPATLYAKWERTLIKTEVDLSDSTLPDGYANTENVNTASMQRPVYQDGALHWVVRNYERQLERVTPTTSPEGTWLPNFVFMQNGKAHTFTKGSRVIVEVGYRVTEVIDRTHGVQIGIGANYRTGAAMHAFSLAYQGNKAPTAEGETQVLSHVWTVDDQITPKITVSGGGTIEITSITLYECPQEIIPQYPVATYDNDGRVTHRFVKTGDAPEALANTSEQNFGGWYKDAAKVEAVTEDVTLTAKWYAKADVNMDEDKDIRDLVFLNGGLADGKSDAVLDYNFNETVDKQDLTDLRVYLLGLS